MRCHQLDGMPQTLQLVGPEMGATTSFHADQTGGQVGKDSDHLVPLELLFQKHFAALIHAMNLQDIFGQIDANRGDFHSVRLSTVSGNIFATLAR